MTATIDLTPTPEGVKHMRQLFLETKKRAEEMCDALDNLHVLVEEQGDGLLYWLQRKAGRAGWLKPGMTRFDVEQLLDAALDALFTQEAKRVRDMEAAIDEIDGAGVKP